jgi:hypothetical protein
MDFAKFEKLVDGTVADLNGYGYQCTSLVNLWCIALGIELFPGNAGDFVYDAHPDCEWIPLGPNKWPNAGDIPTWGKTAILPFGHVSIAAWGNAQQFASLDQNWPLGSHIHHELHDYRGVIGWLHPRILDAPPVDPCADAKNQLLIAQRSLKLVRDQLDAIRTLANA